jgi:hypothetical protein
MLSQCFPIRLLAKDFNTGTVSHTPDIKCGYHFLFNQLGLPTLRNSTQFSNILSLSLTESYATTDGQSASLSWNKAPIWGLRPEFYYCRTAAGLFMWGALSDERTGLSFTIAAGPRQRSHSRTRLPSDPIENTFLYYYRDVLPRNFLANSLDACLQFRCLALDVCYCCHTLKRKGV